MVPAYPRRRDAATLVLPALHLSLCVAIQLGVVPNSGEWSIWFWMFVIDFPVSIPLIALDRVPAAISFGVVGTLWWYLLGRVIFRRRD